MKKEEEVHEEEEGENLNCIDTVYECEAHSSDISASTLAIVIELTGNKEQFNAASERAVGEAYRDTATVQQEEEDGEEEEEEEEEEE